MQVFLRAFLITLGLTWAIPALSAFDNDFKINDINLDEANFLDIKAHRYRKSLEYDWFDTTTGWRINIASLDGDLAFLQSELKLQKELSGYVNIRLEVEQEVFYADKEFPLPTAEAEIYPWAGNLGFSLLGTPAYEKREMDLGVAVTWGRRPWNYIRFEYLDVDRLYNEKNATDNTFYSKEPTAMKLEAAYQFGGQYKLRFKVSRDRPLELIDPDDNGIFKHEASDYFLLFDYQPTADSVIGVTVNGFTLDKSSAQTGQDQQQATDFISADVYWVRGMGKSYEVRVGTQYDHISNDIRDYINSNNDLDYFMKTLQVYTTAYHPFNEHMAWDIGLYIGQVEEQQNYLQDSGRDTLNDGIESKLRMGFEYSSSDGRSSLQFNISLNLDDPVNDPGDGGAISFQSVF
ncbi:MAG: hypothetical protein IMF14_08005 [Proteobacteria bacterium]|nr:hypothetical protein [Pseudomonadota bacterium]